MGLYDNIPGELRELPRWVCANKSDKLPMQALSIAPASVSCEAHWAYFETAKRQVERNHYSDIGFVFADDGIIGIDIDDGYDEWGLLSPIAADIIGVCQSYTEKSRSGRGFHILLRGDIPFKGRNNRAGVEIYKSGRYFIMTGKVLLFKDLTENQAAIDYVLDKYFPETRITHNTPFGRYRAYNPVWEEPITGTRVKLRPVYPRIPNGCRNICLTSLAGMLHNQGYNRCQIYDELLYANTAACDPPLDSFEVMTITNSVTRYKR